MDDMIHLFRQRYGILVHANAIMDAFAFTGMFCEVAMSVPVDSGAENELFDLMIECDEAWDELFDKASPDQKAVMHKWFWEHRMPEWRYGYMIDDCLLHLDWPEDLRQESIRLCKLHGIDTDLDGI